MKYEENGYGVAICCIDYVCCHPCPRCQRTGRFWRGGWQGRSSWRRHRRRIPGLLPDPRRCLGPERNPHSQSEANSRPAVGRWGKELESGRGQGSHHWRRECGRRCRWSSRLRLSERGLAGASGREEGPVWETIKVLHFQVYTIGGIAMTPSPFHQMWKVPVRVLAMLAGALLTYRFAAGLPSWILYPTGVAGVCIAGYLLWQMARE